MIDAHGASRQKQTPGWVIAERTVAPASGDGPGLGAQKLLRNAFSVGIAGVTELDP